MKIIELKPSDLKPYEKKNKVHDEQQISMIANSIKEFWFTQPIVIDEEKSSKHHVKVVVDKDETRNKFTILGFGLVK